MTIGKEFINDRIKALQVEKSRTVEYAVDLQEKLNGQNAKAKELDELISSLKELIDDKP
jgi:hypothetical protein